ncbi:MAG: tRNA (N(6)-L-threonylcarbamoyladenosine(37)-C(2))-methylthiotransferase, partial [Nitrososphaerales archaeon]
MLELQTEKKTKIYVEGHGCSASLADTEILSGLVLQGGFELVDTETEADLSVLVTCSVKSVTEQRMLSRIRDLSSLEGKRLVVAGCLSKSEPEKILRINPNLSLLGPGNLDRILPAISDTLSGRQLIATESSKLVKLGMPRTRKNDVIGIVEIASGCLSSCTFCQVKLVKGTVFSYPEADIASEAAALVAQSTKEIWLTSTDNSANGSDSRTKLAKLLKKVCEIEGDFKVRAGMMNPLLTGRMLDELIDAFKHEKMFKFLHLPVQSGSGRILKEMRRGYSLKAFYETLDRFRSEIPRLTLSTDMICGFPSETESEFQESLELLRQSKPDVVNISRFGARSGTRAAVMEDQISAEISKDRSSRMTTLVK